MNASVAVREYAWLTTNAVDLTSLDEAQISESAFEYLCKLNSTFSQNGASIAEIGGRRWLKLNNYVGVIETPCGTRIEIVPKHSEREDSLVKSRLLLKKMILSAMDLNPKEAGPAHLQLFDYPVYEWVISRFLQSLDELLKRGIRFDYRPIEEDQKYLRGQLDLSKYLRRGPESRHCFDVRYDEFSADRAENRIIKTALERACKSTRSSHNWRLSHELLNKTHEIPRSSNIKLDFNKWNIDRLTAHYTKVRPWCELLLGHRMPFATVGEWQGTSFLFPMEKLFETYVKVCLRRQLVEGALLKSKPNYRYLCSHEGGEFFRLEPDLIIIQGKKKWILDTKWKLVSGLQRGRAYKLNQADFYQLFAYGKRYIEDLDRGYLVLIFPKTTDFNSILPPFLFSEGLELSVVPFDLDTGTLENPEQINFSFLTRAEEVIA